MDVLGFCNNMVITMAFLVFKMKCWIKCPNCGREGEITISQDITVAGFQNVVLEENE